MLTIKWTEDSFPLAIHTVVGAVEPVLVSKNDSEILARTLFAECQKGGKAVINLAEHHGPVRRLSITITGDDKSVIPMNFPCRPDLLLREQYAEQASEKEDYHGEESGAANADESTP